MRHVPLLRVCRSRLTLTFAGLGCVLAHRRTGVRQRLPEALENGGDGLRCARLVDKQSEHHKGTIALCLSPTRQTCPHKMSKEEEEKKKEKKKLLEG